MIYAYKEVLDGRLATLAVAGDTVEEYAAFVEAVKGQEDGRNWEETYASNFLDGMRDPVYKGYKHSVMAVYHTDEAQRDAFWAEWPMLTPVNSEMGRDMQADMLFESKERIKAQTMTEEEKNRTIEELHGLDKNDPWDRRSEEEVEADKKMREQIKEMRNKGELSGDSFGDADKQRDARDRPGANNVPGAYGRTQAQDAIKEFEPDWDVEQASNDQLADKLREMGVPDVKGVYPDGEVPQKAKSAPGQIFVDDIRGDRREDGGLDITSIQATKRGGEVDEVEKAAREAAHEAKVAEKKGGKRVFSPEDFAAVLRGDGSADSIVNEEGDDRMGRGRGMARPTLSDHAEQAIKDHQEEQRREMKRRRSQAEKEQDVKARGERDRGVFKGGDLVHDDDATPFADLPEEIRKLLQDNGLEREEVLVKNYPYNSELGGRALLPYDSLNRQGMLLVGVENLHMEGSVTMNGPGVMVVSREDTSKDGWGVYAKRQPAKEVPEGEEPEAPGVNIWLVRVRAA